MMIRPKVAETPIPPSAPVWTVFAMIAPQPANTSANAARPSASARRARSGRCIGSAAAGAGGRLLAAGLAVCGRRGGCAAVRDDGADADAGGEGQDGAWGQDSHVLSSSIASGWT